MLCQNCGKNEATTHIKRIVNGEPSELHLCTACAEHLGYADVFSGIGFNWGHCSVTFSRRWPALRPVHRPGKRRNAPPVARRLRILSAPE